MSTLNANPSGNGRASNSWMESWTHFKIDRPDKSYCRVTFDHPPVNTITARTVAELVELVGLIEVDRDLNVVVFGSANRHNYLTKDDNRHDPAWLALLLRLSRAPVVSIAAIRGRTRGAGNDFVLACDLRFASRENTLLGDDIDGPRAEQVGYVTRAIDDDKLDNDVDTIASRLARLDHRAIALMKS